MYQYAHSFVNDWNKQEPQVEYVEEEDDMEDSSDLTTKENSSDDYNGKALNWCGQINDMLMKRKNQNGDTLLPPFN